MKSQCQPSKIGLSSARSHTPDKGFSQLRIFQKFIIPNPFIRARNPSHHPDPTVFLEEKPGWKQKSQLF